MSASLDDTLAYLDENYLTLPQLAAQTGVPSARIMALIEAGCLPPHSHEACLRLTVTTSIMGAQNADEKRIHFYHPSLVALTQHADALARDLGMSEAAGAIRNRFDADVAQAAGLEPGSPAHRDLAARASTAWRDGTFGVCLKEIAAANMIRKVAATETMKTLLAKPAEEPLTQQEATHLNAALTNYTAVTGPFGPHEIDASTRRLVYEPALTLAEALKECRENQKPEKAGLLRSRSQ